MDKKIYNYYTKLRDLRGYNDFQVATMAGIGKSTFSDWKNGRSSPKQEKLNKIAAVLDVTPEYFINGNETGNAPCPFDEFAIDVMDPVVYSILESMEKMKAEKLARLARYARLLVEEDK